MNLTRQHQEFNYYCLDRIKPYTEEFVVTSQDESAIKKTRYKIGLKAKIKHQECFILYTESDKDLDEFLYISVEDFYNNQSRFFTEVIPLAEIKELIKCLLTINIFEFLSLLEFNTIYEDFKQLIEINWLNLNMDNLIEI